MDTYVFAELVFEDELDVVDGALRRMVVEDAHGACVLRGYQVIQRPDVLPHLNKTPAVSRTHVPQSLRRPQVNLLKQYQSEKLLVLQTYGTRGSLID